MRFVEADVACHFTRCDWSCRRGAAFGGTCKPSPLAEVARGIKVSHTCGMVWDRVALIVADHQVAVLLIKVGREEIHEQTTHSISVKIALIVGDPSITECLKD